MAATAKKMGNLFALQAGQNDPGTLHGAGLRRPALHGGELVEGKTGRAKHLSQELFRGRTDQSKLSSSTWSGSWRHLLTPCFHPKVEDVMQVHIRKQRRDHRPAIQLIW